jgi:hypothetical protein
MSSESTSNNQAVKEQFPAAEELREGVEHGRISYSRLALLGVIIYLLEFAFIIPFYKEPPGAGSTNSQLADFYAANHTSILIYVAGVSVAILGRILFAVALRDVLRQVPGVRALMDFAFGLVVVGVTVESIGLGLEGVAASMGTYGSEPPVAVAAALQSVSPNVGIPLTITFGFFAAVSSLAMLRSRLFARWIGWVGLVGGIAYALSVTLHLAPDNDVLSMGQFIGWVLIVVWMLATAIVLFGRARSRRTASLA